MRAPLRRSLHRWTTHWSVWYGAARRIALLAALGIIIVPLGALGAQGRITGLVRDTSGAGIAGAEVTIGTMPIRIATDEDGGFRAPDVPAGETVVRVRRLGFAPDSVTVTVRNGETSPVIITVTEVAQALSAVVVRAERHPHYTGYLAGFYERRDRGFGHFITGDDIMRRDPRQLTDMFRTIPGITLISRFGGAGVRIRGNRCAPLVWIDGMPAAAGEFDLDALVPGSIAGIEVYSGGATTPQQFVMPFGPTACGTIVLWSRQGELRKKGTGITATELERLVSKLKVYTADNVDVPVHAVASAPFAPIYPESMYKAKVGGRVVVEFVVGTDGRVRMETLGVVSSTDPLFTEAVRNAAAQARFTPAMLDGHRVAQVVRQPFVFVMPGHQPDGEADGLGR